MATQTEQDKNQPVLQRVGRRRFVKQLGAIPPVVLTLSSRPAWAVACYSVQMSGNQSPAHAHAFQCELGQSPTRWLSNSAWPSSAYFGSPPLLPATPDLSCSGYNYTGGTLFSAVFAGASAEPMSKLLACDIASPESHFIAAYLNSLANPGVYVLTTAQVISLYSNPIYPPGYASVTAFLASTWQ